MTSDLHREARELLDGITHEPWSVMTNVDGEKIAVVNDDEKFFIALLHPDDNGTEIGDANNRFIAAAPRLVRDLLAENQRLTHCPHDSASGTPAGRWACDQCGADQGPQDDAMLASRLTDAQRERDEARAESIKFAAELGFGDPPGPTATLDQMVEPIRTAFNDQREHNECPRYCGLCGEQMARTCCPECHGTGIDNAKAQAHGTRDECEHCGGDGWLHDGCAETCYADLVAERDEARATIDRIRAIALRNRMDDRTTIAILAALDQEDQ